MRSFTNIETARLAFLTKFNIEATAIEPTNTGLKKSILDATLPVRNYLFTKGIHDFSVQSQGTNKKVIKKSYLLNENLIIPSSASLYRPETKKGDPRIWFKGLTAIASPNDIISIIELEGELYLVNITRLDVEKLINSPIANPLKELAFEIYNRANSVSAELLTRLVAICKQGPIPALLNADTAIGRTLETLLGININSSKQPDYKGIELKAFRDKRGNRKNLFAQVPDWANSKFKSSAQILANFGYTRGTDYKLYCTVSTKNRNSQGLQLELDRGASQLKENSSKAGIGDFIVWPLELLHKRLLQKHNETFWIAANTSIIGGIEHFLYHKAEHTSKPIVSNFDILLDQGVYFGETDHPIPWQTDHLNCWRTDAANAVEACTKIVI